MKLLYRLLLHLLVLLDHLRGEIPPIILRGGLLCRRCNCLGARVREARGRGGQMVLSHDACCHFDFFPADLIAGVTPRWNFRHIPDDVIPALRKEGVGEEHIHTLTVGNPRAIFERQGGY